MKSGNTKQTLCQPTASLAWPVNGFKGDTNFLYPHVSSHVCIFFFKPTGKISAGRLRKASLKGCLGALGWSCLCGSGVDKPVSPGVPEKSQGQGQGSAFPERRLGLLLTWKVSQSQSCLCMLFQIPGSVRYPSKMWWTQAQSVMPDLILVSLRVGGRVRKEMGFPE